MVRRANAEVTRPEMRRALRSVTRITPKAARRAYKRGRKVPFARIFADHPWVTHPLLRR